MKLSAMSNYIINNYIISNFAITDGFTYNNYVTIISPVASVNTTLSY